MLVQYELILPFYQDVISKGKIRLKSTQPQYFHFKSPFVAIPLVLGLELLTAAATYFMGGTRYAFPHFMYIPIILASYWWNLRGVVAAAVIGGLLLGPWMPMDVADNIKQAMSGCIFRVFMFTLVGVVTGLLFQLTKARTSEQIRLSLLEAKTGLPNLNKLRYELDALTNDEKDFSVIAFHLENLQDINAYIDNSIGEKSALQAIDKLKSTFGNQNVFAVSIDTYIILFPNTSLEDTTTAAEQAVRTLAEPIFVNNLGVWLEIRCGILCSPPHGNNADTLLDKLKIALDRSRESSQSMIVFREEMIEKNKQKLKVVAALHAAIENNEFHMVYQPIIHIASREMIGAEGLLRWNHAGIRMGPGEFIGIAEKAGFISEITKWVIQHTVRQIRAWQDAGIPVKIAVNISSKDLNNDSLLAYARDCMETGRIAPGSLGFELTERVIMENEARVTDLLRQIRKMGIGISIDDFGTGYNSMIQLVTLPISYLKIDKFFIDHIESERQRAVVADTIQLAHHLKMEVIAEGVETEQQFRLLEEMGCDNIQGYYFSKPLSEKEYAEFAASRHDGFQAQDREIGGDNLR